MAGKQEGAKQTPAQKAQAQVAVQQLQDFRQRWMPVQQRLAESIVDMGGRSSFQRQQARGMATTDTATQFGDAQRQVREQSAAGGMGGSSRQKLAIAGLGDDQAMSSGMGLGNADRNIDDAYLQGLTSVMQLGRGEKATAMQGMGDIARRSGMQAASDAQMALAQRAGQAQVAGQALGMGLSGAFGSPSTPAGQYNYNGDASGMQFSNTGADIMGRR